jgi:ribosomal protein S18 acetylase RimI-like enzyme
MAALSRASRVRVRAALPGEGPAVAGLWRELWDAHEDWGGYPGSRDPRVYAQLGARLDEDARVRAGRPLLGRHIHLVADLGGVPCGQVEGWVDRQGVDSRTPHTCEVRSLIVARSARRLGAGQALLDALGREARAAAQGATCVLAAEVLSSNPANTFYDRLGFRAVAWAARIDVAAGAAIASTDVTVRLASSRDDRAVAYLELALAARRFAAGDTRYDRPRPLDPALVGAIARQLGAAGDATQREPTTIVAVDARGTQCGVASFAVHALELPFAPGTRALVGRFAIAEASQSRRAVAALVGLSCRLAAAHGASNVELTDLSEPGTDLYEAARVAGARPWSRVVLRAVRD